MQQQVRGFQISAFFGEIFDRIAAIAQDAGVAINVRDLADAGGGVVEGRVVTHHAEVFGIHLDLPEVGGADSVVRDGDLVGLARAIVDDGERFAGRGGALFFSRRRCGQWGVHLKSSGVAARLPRFLYHSTPKGPLPETGRKGVAKRANSKGWARPGRRRNFVNRPLDNSRYNEYYRC